MRGDGASGLYVRVQEELVRMRAHLHADHLVALATELVGGHLQTIAPDNPAAEIAP